jgi:ABC-type sugar transport system ATPase subunit
VLRAGRLQQVGSPDEIWRAPANRFVATFVGAPPMNLLPADGPLRVPHPAGRRVELGVRPEHLRLEPDGTPATVTLVEPVGSEAYVHLELGGARVVARVAAEARPAAGDVVPVRVRPSDVHFFDAETGERVAS